MAEKFYMSYNNIHKLCKKAAVEIIDKQGPPSLIIAIGGGGFIPARILRSHLRSVLKEKDFPAEIASKNIPIQAIGLSLYENLGADDMGTIGKEVVRTQWLDFGALDKHFDSLIGKNILIVDEVDDTRTTLHYAVTELVKDVQDQQVKLGRTDEKTTFSVFVLHNKDKPKKADLPEDMIANHYFVGETVDDAWLVYPWDADDIDEHTALAIKQGHN